MLSLQDLEVVRVVPTRLGYFVFARYPECRYEYNFYIAGNGHAEGKTSSGNWLDLSMEATDILTSKVRTLFANGPLPS